MLTVVDDNTYLNMMELVAFHLHTTQIQYVWVSTETLVSDGLESPGKLGGPARYLANLPGGWPSLLLDKLSQSNFVQDNTNMPCEHYTCCFFMKTFVLPEW